MNAESACCYSTQKKHTAPVHHVQLEETGGGWGKSPPAQAPGGQRVEEKIPHSPNGSGGASPAWLSSPGDKPPAQVHVQDQMNPLNRLRDLH